MEEQEKKTLTLPPILWEELKNGDLFAIECIKSRKQRFRSGIVLRIRQSILGVKDQSFYNVSITDIDQGFNLKYHPDSLKEAKRICEDYRREHWEGQLDRKIIIDNEMEQGGYYIIRGEGTLQTL